MKPPIQETLDLVRRSAEPRVPAATVERAGRIFDRVPHTASAGPDTSQDAGDRHTDSGKRERNAVKVLRAVARFPGHGWKWHHRRDKSLPLQEWRRRGYDLEQVGMVEKRKRDPDLREMTYAPSMTGLLTLSLIEGGRPAGEFQWRARRGE